jgi:hypothetical protein
VHNIVVVKRLVNSAKAFSRGGRHASAFLSFIDHIFVIFLVKALFANELFDEMLLGRPLLVLCVHLEEVADVKCWREVLDLVDVILFFEVVIDHLLHALFTVVIELHLPTDNGEVGLSVGC